MKKTVFMQEKEGSHMRVPGQHAESGRDQTALTFVRLALALANDYQIVYVIRIADDSYVEYAAEGADKTLVRRSAGEDFYRDTVLNGRIQVMPEDQARFLTTLRKENVLAAVQDGATFTLHYRLINSGKPLWHSLKAVRGAGEDSQYVIIGVRNIDAEKRRALAAEAERQRFAEIALALAQRYEVIYHVDLETGAYTEYSASAEYAELHCGNGGTDFFGDTQRNLPLQIYEEDLPMMQHAMQREELLSHLQENGSTMLNYRLLLDGRPQYVTLFAIRPKEDSTHIIIAVANVDAAVRREQEYRAALGTAIDMARRDALTGVKNKHAYTLAAEELDRQIADGSNPPFAVIVCDINGLKEVNDTQGHSAGDAFILAACRLICVIFKHSPVYRIGGDEFAVLLKGEDYENRAALIAQLTETVEENSRCGGVTVAQGVSLWESGKDTCMQDVFERADAAMYEDKREYKQRTAAASAARKTK